jgi:hypothetical protein
MAQSMIQLRLDGIDVSASELTQRSFRAAPCELLLNVTPDNKTTALATFNKVGEFGPYSGLRVSGIADLSFLADFPDLLYLEILDQKRVNTRALDGLENLRGLRIDTPGAGIDFACFPELEVFVGDWHVDNCNLDRSQELRRLSVWQFKPRTADLSMLANITRLEQLEITQTTISSLEGLETLQDLRYFSLCYAAKLQSLDPLTSSGTEIRELEIQNAKKIASYQPIAAVSRLRRLILSSCAPMADLKWTKGMDYLDFFSFVNTNVEDGDLSPLLNLPKLRYAGTMDKRHHNYKFEQLNELLSQRAAEMQSD